MVIRKWPKHHGQGRVAYNVISSKPKKTIPHARGILSMGSSRYHCKRTTEKSGDNAVTVSLTRGKADIAEMPTKRLVVVNLL
eukprot:1194552-Prorocentrum_minimum.AAC.2